MITEFAAIESNLSGLFGLMEVAEEEIRAGKARHPEAAAAIEERAFTACCPTRMVSRGMTPRMERAWMRDMVERVATGRRLDEPSDVEVLWVLVRGSLEGPLERDHALAYRKLFDRLFPDEAAALDLAVPEQPSWAGAEDEVIDGIRRRMAKDAKRLRGEVGVLVQGGLL